MSTSGGGTLDAVLYVVVLWTGITAELSLLVVGAVCLAIQDAHGFAIGLGLGLLACVRLVKRIPEEEIV